jgi:hypothetical protein
MAVITGNRQLAARARDIADRAGNGTLGRQAGLCLAVCLGTTSGTAAAMRALHEIEQPEIRERAAQLLGELTRETTT